MQILAEDSDDSVNDNYWTYRAEAIPEDELNLKEGEQVLFLCHVSMKEDKRVSSLSRWVRMLSRGSGGLLMRYSSVVCNLCQV